MANRIIDKENEIPETKQHLMEVGLMLMARNTYTNTGVQEICKEAGVTKGGFYHHFKSKADLFKQSSDYLWSLKKAKLDQIVSPDLTPKEQVEELINFLMSAYKSVADGTIKAGFCPIFCAGAQGGTEDEIVLESIVEMSQRIQKYTVQLVKNLIDNNDIPIDTDANETGRLLHYFLQGIIMYYKSHKPEAYAESDLRNGVFRILRLN